MHPYIPGQVSAQREGGIIAVILFLRGTSQTGKQVFFFFFPVSLYMADASVHFCETLPQYCIVLTSYTLAEAYAARRSILLALIRLKNKINKNEKCSAAILDS